MLPAATDQWDKVQEHCRKQGLILVRMSPRRYMVVQTEGATWNHAATADKAAAYFTGRPVFGPATMAQCVKWIAEYGTPLPPEMTKNP